MLEHFTAATFAPLEGDAFRISADDATAIEVELIEVTEVASPARPGAQRVPFSVVFRGPSEPVLEQRIRQVEHDSLGAFDLFLVPIGPDDHGMRYEAAFS